MASISSAVPALHPPAVNDVRPPALDAVDRAILAELRADARRPNKAIAAAVGIAASTCLGRIRALSERGVIRGFHADIDPVSVGRAVQAMIAVRLQSHARGQLAAFANAMAQLPEVLDVYFLAGGVDFYLHIAAPTTDALRNFVVLNLSANPDVALTETNLIFEHLRGSVDGVSSSTAPRSAPATTL